ncbi:flagellar export protein FliJ [Clostridium oryzae]|uniref:Flagellar FliJ protein n=1 Tax=Clostridium oryzae TaxID=1450648 RepID=A0A1V4IU07_9CLOT|nr:flagellar export protein FliJ [Clostridium oryzae]OPJ63275.1 flagellar biosynthesis chaperone [Clostridium oryzae]
MSFKFSLQKLLDMRIENEEKSKFEFMKAKREELETRNKLNQLKQDYKKYNRLDGSRNSVELKILNNYLNALNIGIANTAELLKKKLEVVDERRQDLKTKQIERKTVEILKEKQHAAYLKEEERREQIQNDEFALYAYIRKS